jgi:hypothetical protein
MSYLHPVSSSFFPRRAHRWWPALVSLLVLGAATSSTAQEIERVPVLLPDAPGDGEKPTDESEGRPTPEADQDGAAGDDGLVKLTPPATSDDADTSPAERVRVLTLPLESAKLSPATVRLIEGSITAALSSHNRLQVLSSEDIRRVLELEAQKQVVGCDDSSCLLELAGAMGAEQVVYGRVQKLGSILVTQLNLFDAAQAQAVSRREFKADSVEELLDALTFEVGMLVSPITGVMPEAESSWPGLAFYAGLATMGTSLGAAALGAAMLAGGVLAFESSDEPQPKLGARVVAWAGVVMALAAVPLLVTGAGLTGSSWVLDE